MELMGLNPNEKGQGQQKLITKIYILSLFDFLCTLEYLENWIE